MKKRKVIMAIILVLTAVIVVGMVAADRRRSKGTLVETVTASRGELNSYLSTNAVIQSKNMKSYMGVSQFQVKKVNVKVGDSVHKGQALVEYDLYDLNTSISQARLQHNNAVLQRKQLVKQRDQIKDTRSALESQIEQLEASINPADAMQLQALMQKRDALQPVSDEQIQLMDNSVSLARLALDSATEKLGRFKNGITADFDGVVTELNAAEGGILNPAQPAVVVQQLDNLKAVLSLGKFDAAKIQTGQEAVLKSGSKTYKGIVAFINPAAGKVVSMAGQETSLSAEIDILDKAPELRVDFDVNVDILLGNVKNAVKVPVECIKYEKNGKAYVFSVENNRARRRDIYLGLQSDTETQVTEGLSAGDVVIRNPDLDIEDGAAVRVSPG